MSSQLQLLLEVVFCFTTIIFVAAGSGYAEEAHQQADNVPLPPPPPTSFLHTELSELKANYEAIKRQHPHLFPGAASSKTPRHYSNQTTTTGELLEDNKHRRKRFPRT
jgi:hypothetical protein